MSASYIVKVRLLPSSGSVNRSVGIIYLNALPAIMASFFIWCLSDGGWFTGIANVTVSVV